MPAQVDALLEIARTDPGRVAVLTDFDGTLAEIVDDPAAAVPVAGSLAVLDRLAGRLGLVAVVTGRPSGFVVAALGDLGERIDISALYGLESVPAGPGPAGARHRVVPEVAPWVDVVARVAAAAPGDLPAGVLVEPKGLSVTFHHRTAAQHAAVVEAYAAAVAARTGLVAVAGRAHVELRPPVARDKGTAVRALLAEHPRVDTVAFCGDDTGDLPAFAALADLAAGGTTTLRLVAASEEADPRLAATADLLVPGPAAVVAWLEVLAEAAGA